MLNSMDNWHLIAILAFVIVFNFLMNWILKQLHARFKTQGSVWKDGFIKALYLPLSSYAWLFALVYALSLLSDRVFHKSQEETAKTLLSIGGVIAFAWFLFRWKKNVVSSMTLKSKQKEITVDPGKIDAISKILTVAIIFFAILLFLEVTGRSVSTLIAFGGIGGLALAFASQEIISNFFGGFMIYLTQPFTIGDWIHLPEKNVEGIVEEIGWYMTRIRSLDKRPIYIPNAIFSKLIVITPSRMSHRQIKEVIGIRSEDMPKLKTILADIEGMLRRHPDIDHEQSIMTHLVSFGTASIDIQLSAFILSIDNQNYMRAKEDILLKVVEILDKNDAKLFSLTSPVYNIAIQDSKASTASSNEHAS